jgi:hypothetical protein
MPFQRYEVTVGIRAKGTRNNCPNLMSQQIGLLTFILHAARISDMVTYEAMIKQLNQYGVWIMDTFDTGGSINSGTSLFSHVLEEMAYIIQTDDEGQLQCLTIEFALLAGR